MDTPTVTRDPDTRLKDYPYPDGATTVDPAPTPLRAPDDPNSTEKFSGGTYVATPSVTDTTPADGATDMHNEQVYRAGDSPQKMGRSPNRVRYSPTRELGEDTDDVGASERGGRQVFYHYY